jgi:lysophospholipase L1-like esterase
MRICFVGDSMVNGTGDREHLGWVGRVLQDERKRHPELTGYNLGVRRDRSDQIRMHWKAEVERRLPAEREGRVVFSFGGNDAAQKRDPALTLQDAEAMLTEAKARWPVFMVGAVPIMDEGNLARARALDAAYAPLCGRLGVPFLSVFDGLMATPLWLDEARAGDGAHPGAGGYGRMAGLILASPVWRKWMASSSGV